MALGRIPQILQRWVGRWSQGKSNNYSKIIGMGPEAFQRYVRTLPAKRRIFSPREIELKAHLSALAERKIKLIWGNEEFPKSDFETIFMNWCGTNTPYLSYFIRALHQVVEELDFNPGHEIKLNVRHGEELLGEKFAYLRPIHQKEISLWLVKNSEKLPVPQGLNF
jgi:hypothetical protein